MPLLPDLAPEDAVVTNFEAARKPPQRALTAVHPATDPLLTVEDVSLRLNVSKDWVWDHCSRKLPRLPVIRMGDGALRFRTSAIEAFIDKRERVSAIRGRRRNGTTL